MSNLVSIIIPAFNAGEFLGQTLESVIKQTYSNWECLVINDGSTDRTAEIADSFAATDPRIRCYHKQNGGLSSARNYGISLAKGDYIQYLDSDDVLFEDKLLLMIEAYEKTPIDNMVLFCDFFYGLHDNPYTKATRDFKLSKNFKPGKEIGFSTIYRGWDYNLTIPIHCFLFPTHVVENVFFDEKLRSKEDWNYHLSVLDKNNFFMFFDYVGCSYRVTNNSMSKDYTSMIAASLLVLHRWHKNQLEYFYRLSFYILQAFIYKIKGKHISFTTIKDHFINNHNSYFRPMFFTGLLLPVVLFFKIFNSLRIRLK